ncbi:prepilin-type N-terminal cleavage/methylation domain protein, partial [Acinetobacter baumannii 1406589]
MIKPQQAFTLIELMVALALGLLIVAAGLAVFLSSQRSMGLQSSLEGLQQNANFGLSSLTHDLRH